MTNSLMVLEPAHYTSEMYQVLCARCVKVYLIILRSSIDVIWILHNVFLFFNLFYFYYLEIKSSIKPNKTAACIHINKEYK